MESVRTQKAIEALDKIELAFFRAQQQRDAHIRARIESPKAQKAIEALDRIELCVDKLQHDPRMVDCAYSRQGFSNRQAGRANGSPNQGQNRSQNASPTTATPTTPSGPLSFPANPGSNVEDLSNNGGEPQSPEPVKYFFREGNVKLGVKGNFVPLAAKPAYLDLGDWLAHQTVEQYRLMESLLFVIQEVDTKTKVAWCNVNKCPTMSAGRHYTYTWLNNDRTPIRVPASQYIALVQRWIVGKIHDPVAFPTADPFGTSASSFESAYPSTQQAGSSANNNPPIAMPPTSLNRTLSDLSGRDWIGKSMGFPETFINDIRTAWRQMFRIYAHLYHSHFVEPYWDLSMTLDLNSAFCYFISVGKLHGLLSNRDLEPMKDLVDIWVRNGSIPADCARGASAINQQ
ncbi:MAG: hypothetical protein Q9202_006393 [Teloschistes flavicans]